MNKEKNFTSTANKLFDNLDRLKKIKDEQLWFPINLQLAPTNKCNLNCEFCSLKERSQNEELLLSECFDILDNFKSLGAKSLEITGGGDPTLYPYINELIYNAKEINRYQIGLITNGVALKDRITKENLNRLTWLRISLNGLDYNLKPQIPKIKGTLGFSYVWNKKSTIDTLIKLNTIVKKHGEYLRIVPDCLDYETQTTLKNEVNHLVKRLNLNNKIFIQTKAYDIHKNCFIGRLKPFIAPDGYVYQCSAAALYGRKFTNNWRICHWKDIRNHWPDKFRNFDTSLCEKGKCFYSEHNRMLEDLQQEVMHHGFI